MVQLVPMHGAAQRRVLRDLVPDDQQLHLLEAVFCAPANADQPLEVLVRFDVARIQDERILELIRSRTRPISWSVGLWSNCSSMAL